MSFFSTLIKKEKETDKKGGRASNRRKKVEEKQNKIRSQTQHVDDHIAYILNIYNNYAKHYNENETIRESIDIEKSLEAYLDNLDYGIILTKNAYEKVQYLPYIYGISNSARQYLDGSKKELLLHLENYMKYDEALKNGILEVLNKGGEIDHHTEQANKFLIKAHLHFESLKNHLKKARESVQQ